MSVAKNLIEKLVGEAVADPRTVDRSLEKAYKGLESAAKLLNEVAKMKFDTTEVYIGNDARKALTEVKKALAILDTLG